ncbi:damage-control phosphatase ARMT1-like [Babylonia areolata]|uniref:damage-control phosphatase ARMT1-like n=1 Tax=Babylonia areolata TaxID=304850 RepID=UPI003FD53791
MGDDGIAPPLSAKDKTSFAYYTINARLPVTLAKTTDSLCRSKQKIADQFGKEAMEDVKLIVGRLTKLRYEVQTDKPIAPLESDAPDVAMWNAELAQQTELRQGVPPTWYSATWLYVECYMYRALQDYVALTKNLKTYDLFQDQKRSAFRDAAEPVRSLLSYLSEVTPRLQTGASEEIPDLFLLFVQVALWGNKCDLSISQGAENSQKECLLKQLSHLKPHILIDDTSQVLAALQGAAASRNGQVGRVDIVLDNAGFELVTDLCLAELLTAAGLASHVHFHGKAVSWFVSDVTEHDFSWTLDTMCGTEDPAVSQLGARWKSRLQDGMWTFSAHPFWTSPYSFSLMKQHAPDLYADLAQADLVVFKGDLNYRKLVGDRAWEPTTPFPLALEGFHPAPLCALRALKADTISGLRPGQAEQVGQEDEKWKVNGNWAIVSFCAPPSSS